MKATQTRSILVSLTVLFAGCVGHERVETGKAAGPSADSIKILSISPTVETVLHSGTKVPFRVEVEYTLVTAHSGTITLVIQRGEQEHQPLASETHVIQEGSGKLVLTKEIEVPDTNAIQVFTPLSPQGATSTSVVDTRAYAVANR
jgi:hypothetical protein